MRRRARTIAPADSSPTAGTAPAAGAYQHELAKLRRFRAAVQRTCSECEDYIAHGDERRAKTREPEPVD